MKCSNYGELLGFHCKKHTIPCCPGKCSLSGFYYWPAFWHTFGNNHPIKDVTSDTPTNHKRHQEHRRFCFYCMLEEKAGEMLIEDAGVTMVRIPDGKECNEV